ncbi:MAG: PIN domain-containing protein [Proteobacteria bacterium]|nr:PIN domain-containing protein [Pseudomonadota bacterium]MBU4470832.1 PIN domain-containing protein [Pseudomonadota bacterium]MCG2750970.1 PIN domain-containing protein [Desulfobacteraceae bacterium]
MTDKNVFIDTNIWIYGLVKSDDSNDNIKRTAAISLFEKVVLENQIIVSVQVLNECHWNLVRKFGYGDLEVFNRIQENIIEISMVLDISQITYSESFRIREKYKLSFWDSLVTASAIEGECFRLYSEDFQHGQKLDNLTIINPFILGQEA